MLEVLAERGYEYDCSTLPTYIAPLARAYYFFRSPEMSDEEREKRKKLFGKLSDGFQSLKPRMMTIGERELVEIPVTTFPVVKAPIHFSYLLYLSTISPAVAKTYWRSALLACRAMGIGPSLLLHPLDLLSGDDAPELKFFPGMNIPAEKKLAFISEVLATYADNFELVQVREHADAVRQGFSLTRSEQPQAVI